MSIKYFKNTAPLVLESGHVLSDYQLAYHTFGRLNPDKSNVVWICHALTANSDAEEWWPGLVGPGKLIDTNRFFVVCANMLGSSYGSTNPSSFNPLTGEPYLDQFPLVTIRDMVISFKALADFLEIDQIHCCLGGSTGGMQVVEWAIIDPDRFKYLGMLACDARFSAWGIAFNESQRMALLSDRTIYNDSDDSGAKGLAAARSIAMLSYRHFDIYESAQTDTSDPIDKFKASSYQRYQGEKLRKRFEPWSYYFLTKAMDSHNVGRGRNSVAEALSKIKGHSHIVGIDRDILFPFHEQEYMHSHIPNSSLHQITSPFGHDAFLIEYEQLSAFLKPIFD